MGRKEGLQCVLGDVCLSESASLLTEEINIPAENASLSADSAQQELACKLKLLLVKRKLLCHCRDGEV